MKATTITSATTITATTTGFLKTGPEDMLPDLARDEGMHIDHNLL